MKTIITKTTTTSRKEYALKDAGIKGNILEGQREREVTTFTRIHTIVSEDGVETFNEWTPSETEWTKVTEVDVPASNPWPEIPTPNPTATIVDGPNVVTETIPTTDEERANIKKEAERLKVQVLADEERLAIAQERRVGLPDRRIAKEEDNVEKSKIKHKTASDKFLNAERYKTEADRKASAERFKQGEIDLLDEQKQAEIDREQAIKKTQFEDEEAFSKLHHKENKMSDPKKPVPTPTPTPTPNPVPPVDKDFE